MKKIILIIIAISFVGFLILNDDGTSQTSYYDYSSDYGYGYEEVQTIERDEAIDYYWDEIMEYVDGYEEVEAYSYESGNYYYLDADISSGVIDTIYFPNEGYLYVDAEIDEDGDAYGYDYDAGNYWDFTFDMDSSIVDDAVYDWASDNEFELY